MGRTEQPLLGNARATSLSRSQAMEDLVNTTRRGRLLYLHRRFRKPDHPQNILQTFILVCVSTINQSIPLCHRHRPTGVIIPISSRSQSRVAPSSSPLAFAIHTQLITLVVSPSLSKVHPLSALSEHFNPIEHTEVYEENTHFNTCYRCYAICCVASSKRKEAVQK